MSDVLTPLKVPDRRSAAPWFIVEGALLIVLAAMAVALPAAAGIATAFVFGWALLLSGVFGLASLFAARHHTHMTWGVVSSVAALIVGALIVWRPLAGAVTISLFIAVYLLIDGLALLGLAGDQHKRGGRGWGWLVAAGAIDVLLALLILLMGPLSDAVLLGLIVALDLLIGGVALVSLGLAARRA
jgi:uncharacterized membrane protein HdeD (DUF308 family)